MQSFSSVGARGKAYALLIAVVLLGAGLAVLGWLGSEASGVEPRFGNASRDRDEAIPVSVETAVRGPISHSLASTANLRARQEVDIATQAAGIVTAVQVEEGNFVQSGQVLCSLDDRQLRIELELVQQRLAQTKIQVESAKIREEQTRTQIRNKRVELDRNEKALADGLLAESEVALERHQIEDLEHELRVVDSTVRENLQRIDQLESEIRKVELQLSQTAITAPFSGRITERTVELGQSVRAAEKLFTLSAFPPIYADVYLAEHDSRRTRPGQPVSMALGPGGETAQGAVERVSPVVDAETGTVKVTTRFQSPGPAFRPGSFVRVEIQTDTRLDAILIPKQAVLEEEGRPYVVLVDANGTALRTTVELGYQDGSAVEAVSGVNEGAMVVTAGQGKLKDGDITRVVTN